MIPFRKIVFPVDYSDAGRSMVPFVRSTVELFAAELTLVHAYGPEGLSFVDLPIASPDLPQQVHEFENLRLREYSEEFFPGFRTETFAELGEAGTVIQSLIERQGCDLVMLPTHGRGPIRRLMLGSVTMKVLHDAGCAVWTATPAAIEKTTPECRTVVCAVDDNEEGKSVMVAGAAVAKEYKAQLAIVHVLDLPPMSMEIDYAAIKNELVQGKQARLREMVAGMNLDAPHSVIEGSVAHGLHDWLGEHHADLLVTGRGHAQEGLGRVWSNLYSIVREAPCPVLSI
jgi:nucleotide-binding universal stress UspA family protein